MREKKKEVERKEFVLNYTQGTKKKSTYVHFMYVFVCQGIYRLSRGANLGGILLFKERARHFLSQLFCVCVFFVLFFLSVRVLVAQTTLHTVYTA